MFILLLYETVIHFSSCSSAQPALWLLEGRYKEVFFAMVSCRSRSRTPCNWLTAGERYRLADSDFPHIDNGFFWRAVDRRVVQADNS